MSSQQVVEAERIASKAHADQLDKVGAPYIQHPEMVAAFVADLPEFANADDETQQDAIAAAWLHDTIEDHPQTTAESLAEAGISPRAVAAVVALTRNADVTDSDYYLNLKSQPVASMVKTADLASNLLPERVAQLDEATRGRLAIKYDHALEVLGVNRSVITELHDRRAARR